MLDSLWVANAKGAWLCARLAELILLSYPVIERHFRGNIRRIPGILSSNYECVCLPTKLPHSHFILDMGLRTHTSILREETEALRGYPQLRVGNETSPSLLPEAGKSQGALGMFLLTLLGPRRV